MSILTLTYLCKKFHFIYFFIYHVFSRIIMRHFNLTSIFFLKLIRIDIYGFKINKLNFIIYKSNKLKLATVIGLKVVVLQGFVMD